MASFCDSNAALGVVGVGNNRVPERVDDARQEMRGRIIVVGRGFRQWRPVTDRDGRDVVVTGVRVMRVEAPLIDDIDGEVGGVIGDSHRSAAGVGRVVDQRR